MQGVYAKIEASFSKSRAAQDHVKRIFDVVASKQGCYPSVDELQFHDKAWYLSVGFTDFHANVLVANFGCGHRVAGPGGPFVTPPGTMGAPLTALTPPMLAHAVSAES